MVCSNCDTENEAGRKFCKECAARLAVVCPACGAANSADANFCGERATPLATAPSSSAQPGHAPAPTPVAERRVVSDLFADLVGFTTLAEGRDAEDTRELLPRYFDLSRDVIGRYGGTVEKFIGDAVMAVWGAPVAHEDDAERAVRAGLELVDVVKGLGPGITARAGVLTESTSMVSSTPSGGTMAGAPRTARGSASGRRARWFAGSTRPTPTSALLLISAREILVRLDAKPFIARLDATVTPSTNASGDSDVQAVSASPASG